MLTPMSRNSSRKKGQWSCSLIKMTEGKACPPGLLIIDESCFPN